MKLKKIILSTMCIGILAAGNLAAQTKVIAHRGYWDCEGSAQNSISSLKNAQKIQAYGSEFDVIITSDGTTIINHDDDIDGMHIEDTPYIKLKNYKLKNGEILPTLENYLKVGKINKSTQLILEIKPHKAEMNEDRAVKKTLALVKKYGMEKQVEFISFSLNICKELIKYSPNSQVSYLGGDLSPKEAKEIGLTGIDYHYSIYEKNPSWIKEAKALNLTTNAWTVDDTNVMKYLIKENIDFITTDKPVILQELINKSK